MQNGIFTTNWAGIGESLLAAVVLAVLAAFGQIVLVGNFDVFTANWASIGHTMVNVGFISGVGFLVKDFLSTNTGSFLGITPGNQLG